jgi:hypothetical protein
MLTSDLPKLLSKPLWFYSSLLLTIFTFAIPELLDLIWWKIGFLPYVVWQLEQCFSECFEILSPAYRWREEDLFHFWRFSLLSFQSFFHHIKFNNSGTTKVKIVKNERDPPLFTGKLLIKFQNILRNTTQVIIRHRVKILFSGYTGFTMSVRL